jgi:hypothetical protein
MGDAAMSYFTFIWAVSDKEPISAIVIAWVKISSSDKVYLSLLEKRKELYGFRSGFCSGRNG